MPWLLYEVPIIPGSPVYFVTGAFVTDTVVFDVQYFVESLVIVSVGLDATDFCRRCCLHCRFGRLFCNRRFSRHWCYWFCRLSGSCHISWWYGSLMLCARWCICHVPHWTFYIKDKKYTKYLSSLSIQNGILACIAQTRLSVQAPGNFQCLGIQLVGQGPAKLTAGAGWGGCVTCTLSRLAFLVSVIPFLSHSYRFGKWLDITAILFAWP